MTVADMIAQRKIALDCILNDSNNAISAKGGTPADNLSGLQDAIVSIPSGGVLPELTDPAEVGHVIAGKEYIDGSGNKQTGTLVVCDSIEEVETIGEAGVGLNVDIKSPVDGSAGELKIPEQHLLPENIKNGVSIFGIAGSAKTMRVESGTITPAKDSDTMTIEISGSPKAVSVVAAQTHTPAQDDILGACYDVLPWRTVCGYNGAILYFAKGLSRLTQVNVSADAAAIGFPAISSSFHWRAGVEYTWTAYYWEDDA